MTNRCVLVTGAAGFIGGAVVRRLLSETRYSLVLLDALTYAARIDGIADALKHPRVAFIQGNVCDHQLTQRLFLDFPIDSVLHLAAESHVDRSINDADPFVQTNIVGTVNLMQSARHGWERRNITGRWIQVSTDEVYGSLDSNHQSSPGDPLQPNSPYAAAKGAADLLVRSFEKTYRFPAIITRCCNNYGPFQNQEKLIPQLVRHVLQGKPMPIYGQGDNVREWLHVEDHAQALVQVLLQGEPGNVYHIGSAERLSNLDLAEQVGRLTWQWAADQGKTLPPPTCQLVTDRPGHDQRYALDSAATQQRLGWKPQYTLAKSLPETVAWLATDASRQQPADQDSHSLR